ncbi:MAG: resolvase [Proteobacteria bacterium]|nr:MAG: resolvase [Pseudomonadota bacterium]
MDKRKRAAIYARVSTANHDQNPDIQVQELKKYCEARDWELVHVFTDHASGGTDKREGYQGLLRAIENHEIDVLVVTKLDRLFRSLRQLITALEDFQTKGVAFVALRDAVDYTSPAGKLFTQILGSLAEFEKALVRERTMAGLKYAKEVKGKTLGRPRRRMNLELMALLREQGQSMDAIAKLVGCSQATVSRELARHSKTLNRVD